MPQPSLKRAWKREPACRGIGAEGSLPWDLIADELGVERLWAVLVILLFLFYVCLCVLLFCWGDVGSKSLGAIVGRNLAQQSL